MATLNTGKELNQEILDKAAEYERCSIFRFKRKRILEAELMSLNRSRALQLTKQ